jgi:uncharacterized membrane-anchored protein
MLKPQSLLSVTFFALLTHASGSQDKSEILTGPATAKLGQIAELPAPAGFVFLNGDQTRHMLRAAGDPVSGNELGFLRPTNGVWSAFFDFKDIGYIKDAEKEKLDPAKLLVALKDGTEAANLERAKQGAPPIEIIGWDKEPSYDPASHNLEWCMRAQPDGHEFVNYNTRLLGRKGVMEVVLVVDPADLPATLPEFRTVIGTHQFQTGQSYAEYRPDDKIAKFGLGALVLVGAAKIGIFAWLAVLFKKAWKLVAIAAAAVAGFFKKLFNKITGRANSGG